MCACMHICVNMCTCMSACHVHMCTCISLCLRKIIVSYNGSSQCTQVTCETSDKRTFCSAIRAVNGNSVAVSTRTAFYGDNHNSIAFFHSVHGWVELHLSLCNETTNMHIIVKLDTLLCCNAKICIIILA